MFGYPGSHYAMSELADGEEAEALKGAARAPCLPAAAFGTTAGKPACPPAG
jgi:hypothetical protein